MTDEEEEGVGKLRELISKLPREMPSVSMQAAEEEKDEY